MSTGNEEDVYINDEDEDGIVEIDPAIRELHDAIEEARQTARFSPISHVLDALVTFLAFNRPSNRPESLA